MIPGLGKSLEEEMAMANHFSILSLKIPWIEETWPATVSLWGCKKLGQDGETKPPPQYAGLAKKVHLGFSAPSTEKPKQSFWPTQYSPWKTQDTLPLPPRRPTGAVNTPFQNKMANGERESSRIKFVETALYVHRIFGVFTNMLYQTPRSSQLST